LEDKNAKIQQLRLIERDVFDFVFLKARRLDADLVLSRQQWDKIEDALPVGGCFAGNDLFLQIEGDYLGIRDDATGGVIYRTLN
jgi:hypothetical protein